MESGGVNAPTVGEHCSTSTPYDRDSDENVSHDMRMTDKIMMKMFHILWEWRTCLWLLWISQEEEEGGGCVMSALIWMLALNELMMMNFGDDEDDEDDNDDMMIWWE